MDATSKNFQQLRLGKRFDQHNPQNVSKMSRKLNKNVQKLDFLTIQLIWGHYEVFLKQNTATLFAKKYCIAKCFHRLNVFNFLRIEFLEM